jgi:Fe-S-cluster containining protein
MVVPSGRDVWRIARTLDSPPWTFMVYFTALQPRPDAFYLDQSELSYRLLLGKRRPARRTKAPPPCIFLLRGRDRSHLCGLGELRPLVCQTFPADLVNGLVQILPDTGCTCRAWSLANLDIEAERPLLEQREREAEEYYGIVARWNERVAAAPADTTFEFPDYCRFLLDAYDEIAEAEAAAP